MLGSTILDVAIGIVFIFLLASLMASAIREGIEAWLKTRASHLEAGLREMLKDPKGTGLVQQLYNHPLIYSLYSGEYTPRPTLNTGGLNVTRGDNLPSYIPSRSFALALMDMAARGPDISFDQPTGPITLESIRANIGTIDNPAVQRAILIAIDRAEGDMQAAQANLEAWYNSAMDRVSGWYKRSSQSMLLVIGLLLALLLNINVLKIGDELFHDKSMRDLLVTSAEHQQVQKDGTPLSFETARDSLTALNLPIGWPPKRYDALKEFEDHWFYNIAGWLLTAFAVSVGAPFWFDMLNRLIVVRSTVKPHQKSPEESSADFQSPPAASPPASPPAPVPAAAPVAALPAPQPGQPIPHAPQPAPPPSEPDGCDVDMTQNITTDEMLPQAAGGVR